MTGRCAIWGFRWYCFPFWGWNTSKNPNFGGVSRRFQAKRGKILKVSCYRNCCIDFNEIWSNDRDHQVVNVGGRSRRPTNPRWRTAAIMEKPLNHHLAATVRPILMKFSTMTHQCAPGTESTVKSLNFWKSKMAAAAILNSHKNRDISATVSPISTKFGVLMRK